MLTIIIIVFPWHLKHGCAVTPCISFAFSELLVDVYYLLVITLQLDAS